MNIQLDPEEETKYRRLSLHSMFQSLFWGALQDKHRKIDDIADKTKYNKEHVRSLFRPDSWWSINAIFDVAEALDLELRVEARDRSTGKIYTPSGTKDGN